MATTGGSRSAEPYNEVQFSHNYPDGIDHYYWQRARNRIVARQLDLALSGDRVPVVLDIGCGRGIAVKHLRERGHNAFGCDLGTPAPISKETAPFLHLGTDTFALPAGLRQSVRVILLLDVLEHIRSPDGFLDQCRLAFPEAVVFLITVPAFQDAWSYWDEYYGHYRRYEAATLREHFPEARYEACAMSYFFHALYLPARALTLARWRRSATVQAPHPIVRPLHALVGCYFDWEERLLPSSWRGLSLYGVFKARRRQIP